MKNVLYAKCSDTETVRFQSCTDIAAENTLEAYLDRLLQKNDCEAVLAEIRKFFDAVKQSVKLELFVPGKAFSDIFGDITFPQELKAEDGGSTDCLFGSVRMENGHYVVMDCGWSFAFPVPYLYIVYRAVCAYLGDGSRKALRDTDLLQQLGITEALARCFAQMDTKLRQYNMEKARPAVYTGSDMEKELGNWEESLRNAEAENAALRWQLEQLQQQYDETMRSFSVRITKPLRSFVCLCKKLLKKIPPLYKTARCLKHNGLKTTLKKIKVKLFGNPRKHGNPWGISKNELARQKERKFDHPVTFSIVVPLYNTPKQFLQEMIESVLHQTYGNWELCMADGSDDAHSYVRDVCRNYAGKDARIHYRKLERNAGISENTNGCLEMAQGEYIGLFDHDDLLHPSALYENMCVIEETQADFIYSDETTFQHTPADAYSPHFKPDFSPDTLRSYNYICHFTVFRKSFLDQVGMFRKEFDGSQDYDMILRLTEQAKKIVHIPKILYYWRSHAASTARDISAKTYCMDAAKKALAEHLQRVGLKGRVEDASIPSVYKIRYDIEGEPLISILIPNKDYTEDLDKCLRSILELSTYRNFEIIIIENNSEEERTFAYYREAEKHPQVQVIYWKGEFNYSAINNFGFKRAKGDYILLLNNDVEIITPDWLQEMLMFAQRPDVGAVGAKLYYPDDTIQHAGIILGIGGVAGHSHKNFPRDAYGYFSRLQLAQNLSGVTAACMMVSRKVFEVTGGLDEGFKVAFNDVDFCMKIREAGYLIVFTPFAELYHFESKSRGYEDTPEKTKRFNSEIQHFYSKWGAQLEAGDPYYNPNLTLITEDFAVKKADEPNRIIA